MDPRIADAFARFLQDPASAAAISQSLSQPASVPPLPAFPYPPPPFPPFCTQPPTAEPPPPSAPTASTDPLAAQATPSSAPNAGFAATFKPSSTSRPGRRHRVTAAPAPIPASAPAPAPAPAPVRADESVGKAGRMLYGHEEDIRLASAWLKCSTDPIEGVNRKGEAYWVNVAETCNETTPDERKRDPSCLKGHWHKITPKVTLFNGCYVQLRNTPVSGRNDEMLMDDALALYIKRLKKNKPFLYLHWWKVVCDSPKWCSQFGGVEKRACTDLNMNAPPAPQPRPMGIKRTKRGQHCSEEVVVEVNQHLKSLVEVAYTQKLDVDSMKEHQEKLGEQRVPFANLQLMAAKEKECKLIGQRNKAMDMFTQLLQVDTSKMEQWAKDAHLKAVSLLSEKIWGVNDRD